VQAQDHFDSANTNTWSQAFFVNDTFWRQGSDSPVFLCVGGEGPLFADSVSDSVHCNIAVEWLKETGALMFGIEHRYYGCHNLSSCPYDLKTKNHWQYLTSQQALADIADFHKFAGTEFGLSAKNKWISWGGSYPGMLAGWSRLKYPELIHAAVASSAPVKAQVRCT
jgi:hypothetical protein